MLARIFLNECEITETDGVAFCSVKLSLGKPPVLEGEVRNLQELKALSLAAILSYKGDNEISLSVITRGRAVRGFNAWYESIPQHFKASTANEMKEFK